MGVGVGSGALVPGRGEGSATFAGWVGAASEDVLEGSGVGGAGEGGAAGTATEGMPGLDGGGSGGAGTGGRGVDAARVEAAVLGDGARGVTETVGRGSVDWEGVGVQPATHRPKTTQAAAIVVVLFDPRPACMTAPRSCPSTCTSNVRAGRWNRTCRYGDGSDKS